jgi:glycosyltransferase involved in cell wall biosynthesis
MIKLLIDPQIFNDQKFGGISRYYTEIYYQIKKQNLSHIELPIFYSENIHLNEKNLINNKLNNLEKFCLNYNIFKRKIIRKLKRKNLIQTKKELLEHNFDVLIPSYYNTYFLGFIAKKPFVLTVYDMIHEIFPSFFSDSQQIIENKKTLLYKATKVIAISNSTKHDILKFYPDIDQNKIHVVYLCDSKMTNNIKPKSLPKKYILFVGNREHYKNFIFFAKSVEDILNKNEALVVLCAGGSAFYKEEIDLFNSMGHLNRFIHYRFNDNELAQIYENALCFVFPSIYEGFGIPVLEAMSNRCPCILANHSSFPEVAGDAGIYFELNNQADLAQKIIKTIENKEFRQIMIEKGLANIKKFSWEKVARECFKVYEEAYHIDIN